MAKERYYQNFFNDTANTYGKNLGYYEKLKIKLVKEFCTKSDKVLDIGVANGVIALEIAKAVKKLIGIDFSDEMLKACQKRIKKDRIKNIKTLKMDAHSLQFPENEFNIIISFSSLTYMRNQNKVITEMFKVLKQGGFAIIDIMNRNNFESRFWNKWHKTNGSTEGQNLTEYSHIKEVLEKTGFEIIKMTPVGSLNQLKYIPIIKYSHILFRTNYLDRLISLLTPKYASKWFLVLKKL